MSSGLYYAVCGFRCQEREMEILSHGLANVNTAGFKDDLPSIGGVGPRFDSYLPLENLDDQRRLMLVRKMNMAYPTISQVRPDFSPGQLRYTGNDLDAAIHGQGFFAVDTPQGERYTRMGNFSLNGNSELTICDNRYPLQKKVEGNKTKGPEHITITGTAVSIDRGGSISVDGVPAGSLRVVDFKDYTQLEKIGDHLYANTGGGENVKTAEGYEIQQHHTETSNVNVVQKMIKLINVARICESYQKVIHAIDEMDTRATRDVGAVG